MVEMKNRTEKMQLMDTLDLDEDGTDEVITSTSYYESNDYQILKRGRNGNGPSSTAAAARAADPRKG